MAIKAKFYAAPPESVAALKAGAEHLEANHLAPMASVLRTVHGAPDDHVPHPVYTVDIEAARAGRAPARAKHIAWRNLTPPDSGLAVEVLDRGEQGHEFSQINAGPFVAATHSALAAIASGVAATDGDYTVSILRIMPLYVVALWLRAEQAEDIIIPVGKAPPGLLSGKAYSPTEFDLALKSIAEAMATNPQSNPR
jgi:hypothetical protein